jgi:hypothetical protein
VVAVTVMEGRPSVTVVRGAFIVGE